MWGTQRRPAPPIQGCVGTGTVQTGLSTDARRA